MSVYVYVHACVYNVCMSVCLCVHVCVQMYTQVHYVYVYMCVYLYTYMFAEMHASECTMYLCLCHTFRWCSSASLICQAVPASWGQDTQFLPVHYAICTGLWQGLCGTM